MDVPDEPRELTRPPPGNGGLHVTDHARRALALAGSLTAPIAGTLVAVLMVIEGAKRW
jgi:hypothetical protein